MTEENTKNVNKIVAVTLLVCSFAVIGLLVLNGVGRLHFNKSLKIVVGVVGSIVTLSPFVLMKLKVDDTFLKYYMLVMMSIFIGILGTSNHVGIYITYALVPIVSSLYFDRKLTTVMSFISYIIMTVGVYINTMGKLEITYLGWNHSETFFIYMAGFTLEYVVVMLFNYQMVKRSRMYMDSQREAYNDLKAEQRKYTMLVGSSRDVIFEYSLQDDTYHANRSFFSEDYETNKPVDITDFSKYKDDSLAATQKYRKNICELVYRCIRKDTLYVEHDFSYELDGKKIPLWYQFEGVVLNGENNEVRSVLGKLQNITASKLEIEAGRQQNML